MAPNRRRYIDSNYTNRSCLGTVARPYKKSANYHHSPLNFGSLLLKGMAYMHVLYYKAVLHISHHANNSGGPFGGDCKAIRRDLEGALKKLMEKHEKRQLQK